MPWSFAILLVLFVPSFDGRHHHVDSRLLRGQRYDKLSKYLLRQDALLTRALEALDKEVAVGEKIQNRHQMDASHGRHHITQRHNHFLERSPDVVFTEVQPYTDEFAIPDFEEVPIGGSPESGPETSVAGGCRCAGAASAGNAGNSDCKTTFKRQAWCYVKKGSGCKDSKNTDKMPNFSWSFDACGNGMNPGADDETAMKETTRDEEAAESAIAHGGCRCAGVSGEKDAGAADCRSTWKDIPWCYVDKSSSCEDKQISKTMSSHDWSHEACHKVVAEAIEAEETLSHTGCACSGESGSNNAGASDCKSTWKNVPWCYVLKTASCTDKMASKKMPTHDWSHEACGEMVKEMEEAELKAEEMLAHNGHDSCACAGVSGENNSGANDCKSTWKDRSWCYVDKSSSCSDAKDSSKMKGYHWSHDACKNGAALTKSDASEVNVAHHGASCACADHKINNMGGADCKSKYDGTGISTPRAWCYVKKKSGCKDSTASESHPLEFDWSYAACESSVASGANNKGSDPTQFAPSSEAVPSTGAGEVAPSTKLEGKTDAVAQPAPEAQAVPAPADQLVAPDSMDTAVAEPGGPDPVNQASPTPQQAVDTPVGAAVSCRCSEGYATGDGGKDCGSKFEDKAWCYVDLESACNDKRQSSRFPSREWSHLACARPL